MFDHLDDPTGFHTGPAFREAVVTRGRRLRRRRRLSRVAGATAGLLAGLAVAGATYVDRRDDAIDRVDVAGTPSLDGASNILLVGTDERPEAGPDAPAGARADTIVVVRVAEDGSVSLLGLPRDLVAPGSGERLSGTYEGGGPQGLVDAVTATTGIPVDHYVQVGPQGLADLVDELGGVDITVDRPLQDRSTGLDLAPGACQRLDGPTTAALARSRHVDAASDLGRMARNLVLVQAALAELRDAGTNPGELDRLSRIAADHVALDSGLGLRDLVELGEAVASGPGLTRTEVLPVAVGEESPWLLNRAEGSDRVAHDFGAPAPTTTTTVADQSIMPPAAPLPVPAAADIGIRPCER